MNKMVFCKIKGISALLMHAYPLVPIEGLEKRSPEEQAEFSAYRDPDTNGLYFPGINVQRAIVAGAAYSKGKGRASLQKPVAACLAIHPERCALGVNDYKLDARSVVIPATKGRIVRYRPRLDEWQLSFDVEFDPLLIKEEEIRRVIDDTGSRVGIGDFRPERKGPFGRFIVIEWK